MRRLLKGLGGALALIIVLELLARAAGAPPLPRDARFPFAPERRYPDQIVRDADLFWKYRPNQSIHENYFATGVYNINSLGFRSPEFEIPKPARTTRIVCLGGTTTFGLNIAESDVYPRKLEEFLTAQDGRGRHWEVINLGVTDYSSYQGLRLAEQWLPRLDPDVVFINYAWGDLQPAADDTPDSDYHPSPWAMAMQNALLRSAIVRHACVIWHRLVGDNVLPDDNGRVIRRVPLTEFTPYIEKLCRTAKACGARPIVVTSPIAWPPPGYSDAEGIFNYHHRYRRGARFGAALAKCEFVEMAVAFDQHPEFFDNPSRDFANFNRAGHAFAGDFLGRYLLGMPDSTSMFPDRG